MAERAETVTAVTKLAPAIPDALGFGSIWTGMALADTPASLFREDGMLWITAAVIVVGAGYALIRKRRKLETGQH